MSVRPCVGGEQVHDRAKASMKRATKTFSAGSKLLAASKSAHAKAVSRRVQCTPPPPSPLLPHGAVDTVLIRLHDALLSNGRVPQQIPYPDGRGRDFENWWLEDGVSAEVLHRDYL